jgi:ribose-phosphate pyrophosphokinase
MSDDFVIFSGSANPRLAEAIARELGEHTGACTVERFPDGEVAIKLLEPVRGKQVVLVQPTSPPVNDHLLELAALADACRRGAAARITAVVPYFGYGRSDKRQGRSEPIMGRVVADLLESVGVGHVITLDLHTPQTEGFFHAPIDILTAVPTLCDRLRNRLPAGAVVVSPDVGRVTLATQYAECLDLPLVVMHKKRVSGSETQITDVTGDVALRACLLVDDVISTGGTILESVKALLEAGARHEIIVAATHGLFVAGAREKLSHPAINELVVTDTVPVTESDLPRIRVISVAPIIAACLERLLSDGWRKHEPTIV